MPPTSPLSSASSCPWSSAHWSAIASCRLPAASSANLPYWWSYEPASMSLDRVDAGRDVPEDFNVVIEIPMNSEPVKYEVDKASGAIFVDRVLTTPMHYPCNYGYVPRTLSGDGDPVDVLVVMPLPLVPGCIIRCR